jgi:hypothetical protein
MTTPIFHITHVRNLASIIACGELRAISLLSGAQFTNLAHARIQQQRAKKSVPCGQGGILHDYVPFYFGPRSPMLFAVFKNQVEGYADGQNPVVHLVSSAEAVHQAQLDFVFTDGHAVMAYSEFYEDLADLPNVDLALMRSKLWHDTPADPDRKRRRQAEFLVHRRLPWTLVDRIVVRSKATRIAVETALTGAFHKPAVEVRPNWYYV